jgi:DNA transformation protein and related proteins
MASSQSTVDFLIGQITAAGDVDARKMFGEYGIYCDGKIIGLVCDDQFFLKPTSAARDFIGEPIQAPPYEGAKPSFLIASDRWDDGDWMAELVRLTTLELPATKPRKKAKP